MDTIPPQHTDGAIELLRRGVEVYYLRRLTLIEKMRGELKLPKSTRGDIKALMSIEERWFRRVTEDFLVLRRMILAYRSLLKTHQQLLNKYKALSEAEREVLKPAISSIEKQMVEMARMIVEEAGKRYPAYNVLLEGLGINDGLAVREALAELLVYVDFVDSSLRGLKRLLGLYKPTSSSRTEYWRLYNGRLHRAVTRLEGKADREAVLGAGEKDQATNGDCFRHRDRPPAARGKTQNYTHRGLKAFNRRSIFSGGLRDINPGVWGS
jgi:hypothetical protein